MPSAFCPKYAESAKLCILHDLDDICFNFHLCSAAMAVVSLFWLIVLIVVIFMVVRKIRNEAKVRNGRIQLAGKVRRMTATAGQEFVFIRIYCRWS